MHLSIPPTAVATPRQVRVGFASPHEESNLVLLSTNQARHLVRFKGVAWGGGIEPPDSGVKARLGVPTAIPNRGRRSEERVRPKLWE